MQKRILIAEDDVPYREVLIKVAENEGYNVIAVGNGAELLNVVNETDIDVVLTDLLMPYLSGTAAIEIMQLRGDKTPIVAITGVPYCAVDNANYNSVKIYRKPINMIELFGYIKSLFQM